MTVSVVVVHHNRYELLCACLESLQVACATAAVSTEVVVVDNGSSDDSRRRVQERFQHVALVALPSNVGFAAGVNAGIEQSSGQWVLTLNNDTTLAPDALAQLLAVARRGEDIGAVGGQLRFASDPDRINSAGIEVDRLGIAADRLVGAPVGRSENDPTEVFGVSAGAALYRRDMLDAIGGFDSTFFAYLEDVDVAWRARMSGWRAFYAPQAVIYHHHSATSRHGSDFKYFQVGLNRVRLVAKNAERRQLRVYFLPMIAYDVAYVVFAAASDRTLAPLRGRLAGLSQWRRYRRAGADARREVTLGKTGGLTRAIRRRGVWVAHSRASLESVSTKRSAASVKSPRSPNRNQITDGK